MPQPRPLQLPALSALLVLLACTGPGTAPGLQPPVAVWSYEALPDDPRARAEFWAFAREHRVQEVYLDAHAALRDRDPRLGAFIQEASERGLRVGLLIGAPEWSTQPAPALELARRARNLTRELRAAGRALPSSLHLDVEPHALKGWSRDWQPLAQGFLDLLESVRSELQGELPLAADLPVWWDGRSLRRQGRTRPLSDWVIEQVDQPVLMDYRDRVPRILESAEGELKAAERLGKRVVIGLNARRPDSHGEASTTFYEEGQAALASALGELHARLEGRKGYGGLAVFSDAHWRKLKR